MERTAPGTWYGDGEVITADQEVQLFDALGDPEMRPVNINFVVLADHHFDKLEAALRQLNHMGGDERGGYCICPVNDGSAPQYRHSSCCVDARAVLAAIAAERG